MSGWLNAIKTDAPEAPVEPNAPSAPTASSSVTKVVVDTNAIVKGLRLERFADEAVTIPEVLHEVRDRQARHTLATLPFELKVQDPDADSIAAVRRFAKTTLSCSGISSVIAVRMGPGQMQLTVIPSRPSSTASDLVSPITPCLAAV